MVAFPVELGECNLESFADAGENLPLYVKWGLLHSSVRPVITYWFMALYCAAKTATVAAAVTGGAGWGVAILYAWTEADQALWAGVLNFWFLGRVFDRVRS